MTKTKDQSPKTTSRQVNKPADSLPKTTKPHPKSINKSRGRHWQTAASLVDKTKTYSVAEAVQLVKKISYANFDASVELHINTTGKTGLLAKVDLPHGTGKQKRVAIADDKLIAKIEKGEIDFDILIAHPQVMPKLAKLARVLGPRGLMPNPKNNTITTEPDKLKAKLSQSKTIAIKTEAKFPVAHIIIGKTSFTQKQLSDNLTAVLKNLKPSEIKSIYLTPTMGPSIKLTFPLN